MVHTCVPLDLSLIFVLCLCIWDITADIQFIFHDKVFVKISQKRTEYYINRNPNNVLQNIMLSMNNKEHVNSLEQDKICTSMKESCNSYRS